jgi:predicted RNA binding protein YcfA (HicA-like mRNA interferase family)
MTHLTADFSGREVIKVLSNVGGFKHKRTNGSHYILEWTPPETHKNSDRRIVAVPFNDEIHEDTMREIAENAGAVDFDKFCEWVRKNK